jgi:AcrR family transcriptional regulator
MARGVVAAEAEGRRAQVLRVARSLFARRGYSGAGLREIAAAVGIRAPSLFKHFPGKTALYNEVLLGAFEDLAGVTEVLEGEETFEARFEAYVRGYLGLLARQRSGAFRNVPRGYLHLALSGAILYYGVAAHSYLATAGAKKTHLDPDAWVATLLEMVRNA